MTVGSSNEVRGYIASLGPRHEMTPGLWQGYAPETYVGYDLVVNCERHVRRRPLARYEGMFFHVPMSDDDSPVPEVAVAAAALAAASVVEAGGQVLVHCTAGLNRSGLVVARIFHDAGFPSGQFITHMRCTRHAHVLSNRSFVAAIEAWERG